MNEYSSPLLTTVSCLMWLFVLFAIAIKSDHRAVRRRPFFSGLVLEDLLRVDSIPLGGFVSCQLPCQLKRPRDPNSQAAV